MATTYTETIRVGCKINLWLRVTGRLENGYHTLDSFFLPLDEPHDILRIASGPTDEAGLHFSCSIAKLEADSGTVHTAYGRFVTATGFAPALVVRLDKGIPMGAGLGGGSADAAALLCHMHRLAVRAGAACLSSEELAALAASIGADVPFFLRAVPARVGGIGEIIAPSENPVRGTHLLLLCPGIHVATAWAFQALDALSRQNIQSVLTSSPGADKNSLVHGACFQNDLERVVFGKFPELVWLRDQLLAHGAFAARMSGSGSSLFGLFSDREQAARAQNVLNMVQSYLHEL